MLIHSKNLRATALEEFWGTEYDDPLYLWEGSKHKLTLEEIIRLSPFTCPDYFKTKEEITLASNYCKEIYYKYIPILANKLNKHHKINFPVSSWEIAFGYWLYRQITSAYDKFVTLEHLDLESMSVFLLDESCYYIPQNHFDYVFCFAGDFGVQQMVSQYFTFKGVEKPIIKKTYSDNQYTIKYIEKSYSLKENINKIKSLVKKQIKKHLFHIEEQKELQSEISLLEIYFTSDVFSELIKKSKGRINKIKIPNVNIKNKIANISARKQIFSIETDSNFENYLLDTLIYSTPKFYIENFKAFYLPFKKDIKNRNYKYIASEGWISDIAVAIYLGIAKQYGASFICHEHASARMLYENCKNFIGINASDIFVSAGWRKGSKNLVQGGFAARDIQKYKPSKNKTRILFVSRTKFIYTNEFSEYNVVNSFFIKELKLVTDFMNLLPKNLKPFFEFRPRVHHRLWDTESVLTIKNKNIKVDSSSPNSISFSESIHQTRIVIIDHMTSGFAELILSNIPFLLLYDIECFNKPNELNEVLNDLIAYGVVHTSSQSAIAQLDSIYDNVPAWWQNKDLQMVLKKLQELIISPAQQTTDYLLSLLK